MLHFCKRYLILWIKKTEISFLQSVLICFEILNENKKNGFEANAMFAFQKDKQNVSPVGENDAIGVRVENVDDGVCLDEGFDLAQDQRPFKL